jgi:hypothetical protein
MENDQASEIPPMTMPALQIGDMGMVTWRDGKEKLLAIIIERRAADYWSNPPKRKKGTAAEIKAVSSEKSLSSAVSDYRKADEWHYYVHYVHHDRYAIISK